MHITPLCALADNYIWLINDDHGNCIVVDPGDAVVVEQALAERQLVLKAILLTHHHDDHIGGVASLRKNHPVPVYAPVDKRIVHATDWVSDGDTVDIQQPACRFQVMAVPGHTLSHVAYVGAGVLFCGDTLFSLGCGRLFEGTPRQMMGSLDRLSALPAETLVCAGHEYTEANGRFAYTIEPTNPDLNSRNRQVDELRAKQIPTLPVPLASELACNPFLRIDSAEVISWCRRRGVDGDRIDRFAAVRAAKDAFRG
ncbi:MAG: hydroxyacylglutathione hydrolase [Pseudomonadota bacterium]|nr:hydroxyacylglutathione hydrolase [Pseudomonadota bacterium]